MMAATLAWLIIPAAPTVAQTAPVSRDDPNRQQAAVELSPFVVASDQDTGYLASSTLAGSRLNTPLKDTAASISVLTSEFLSDIGAFDISEAMHYSMNVEYQVATNPLRA